jgi:acyl-coenzyme A synthetase/AMP-(fatty) acid ligase
LDLASSAKYYSEELQISLIPWQNLDVSIQMKGLKLPFSFSTKFPTAKENDVAYIHHTSGTSSGLPKPIPQTHRGGVGVFPSFDGANSATFTTTPLYHGGVADCFRAWTSGAMIWLFPGDRCPITTKNILSCIDVSEREVESRSLPPVKYFSSVPYVLQMLAEDNAGVQMLQRMDIVGVGGAALPPQVGDDLVNQGVRLVSRFGSAECGFLLSSSRDFEADKDWQYLRLPPHSENLLQFQQHPSDERLFELMVLPQWPHIAKRNRQDGSFATSDLFERHPTIQNAWKYHSRSDSQITLLTGKKFDPAPIEDDIASKSQLIREVLVFGDGKQVPGALIFLASRDTSVNDDIWKTVQAVNQKGQSHTRILRERIKILGPNIPSLARSSKGTLLRAAANETFAQHIEQVYIHGGANIAQRVAIQDQDVKQFIRELVNGYLVKPLADDNADFYKCGVDSATCTQIRSILQKVCAHTQFPSAAN